MKIVRRLSCAILCILSFCFFPFGGIIAEAYAVIEAVIPVTCLDLKDKDGHIYEIAIESVDSSSPVPTSDTLHITDNGEGEFTIEITEPGTYAYKVYEKPGMNGNIVYDNTVYYVAVFVTNAEENDLCYSVSVSASDKTNKTDAVMFRDAVMGETVVYTTTATTMTTAQVSTTSATETSVSSGGTSDTTDSTSFDVSTTSSNGREATTVVTGTEINTSSGGTSAVTKLIHNILTGDSTPIGLLVGLMLLSLVVGTIAVLKKRKKEERGQ